MSLSLSQIPDIQRLSIKYHTRPRSRRQCPKLSVSPYPAATIEKYIHRSGRVHDRGEIRLTARTDRDLLYDRYDRCGCTCQSSSGGVRRVRDVGKGLVEADGRHVW